MNDMLKMGLILMTVTLIASLALAITNYYTEMQIEKQKEMAIKESLNKVITAESFQEKDGHYEAYDKDGSLIGYVMKVEAAGYSSIIQALVGVDTDNKITGVDVISQQETPGLGANIEKESFLQQFIGKTKDALKIKKDGGNIDAITGATISSRSLTDGIREALEGSKIKTYAVTSASPEWNNSEDISEENATTE